MSGEEEKAFEGGEEVCLACSGTGLTSMDTACYPCSGRGRGRGRNLIAANKQLAAFLSDDGDEGSDQSG